MSQEGVRGSAHSSGQISDVLTRLTDSLDRAFDRPPGQIRPQQKDRQRLTGKRAKRAEERGWGWGVAASYYEGTL